MNQAVINACLRGFFIMQTWSIRCLALHFVYKPSYEWNGGLSKPLCQLYWHFTISLRQMFKRYLSRISRHTSHPPAMIYTIVCPYYLDGNWMTHPRDINRQNDLEHHLELSCHYFRMYLGCCPPQHPWPWQKMAHSCFVACGNQLYGSDCARASHHMGYVAAGKGLQISRAI